MMFDRKPTSIQLRQQRAKLEADAAEIAQKAKAEGRSMTPAEGRAALDLFERAERLEDLITETEKREEKERAAVAASFAVCRS